ncbi:TPA: radical SAM protein [Campylobacter jejuni]|nr:radical SAM protein [Campylobacter jejuni]
MIDEGKKVVLTVIPTTLCNRRCPFCFYTEQELLDSMVLPLHILRERVREMIDQYPDHDIVFTVYGGEVFLLPQDYLKSLYATLLSYNPIEVVTITNGTEDLPEFFKKLDKRFRIVVSYYKDNTRFKKTVLSYIADIGISRVGVNILRYKTGHREIERFLKVNNIRHGLSNSTIKTKFNNTRSLLPTKVRTDEEFKKTSDSHEHSYHLFPNGTVRLSDAGLATQVFSDLNSAIAYRRGTIQTEEKCQTCAIRGTCPTLPVCMR